MELVTVNSRQVGFTVNKSGQGIVILSQKQLGQKLGLKGSALKRAHVEYRLAAGRVLNARLGASLGAGKELVHASIPTKKGWIHKTTLVENITAPAPSLSAKDKEIARLQAELEQLRKVQAVMALPVVG